jgi:hypothetical protein
MPALASQSLPHNDGCNSKLRFLRQELLQSRMQIDDMPRLLSLRSASAFYKSGEGMALGEQLGRVVVLGI